eukprot:3024759-Pyramimonas_sp.AAC.1
MQSNENQRKAVQSNTKQCNAMQRIQSATHCTAMQSKAMKRGENQCSAMQSNPKQRKATQSNPVQSKQ